MTSSKDITSLLAKHSQQVNREVEIKNMFVNTQEYPEWLIKNFYNVDVYENGNNLVFSVSRDYLSLGENNDLFRTPLLPKLAQTICTHYNCILPTRKIVNLIWKASTVKLSPIYYQRKSSSSPSLTSFDTFVWHNNEINKDIAKQDIANLEHELIAGHKKDIVVCKKLSKAPNSLFIYGWHRKSGIPVQGLSDAHDGHYVDYSHGVRLISKECWLNGVQKDLEKDILMNPEFSYLVSDEGPLSVTRY